MYDFITWVIEYSEDDPVASVLFIILLPFLLIAKLILRSSELIGGLIRRRPHVSMVTLPSTASERVNI